MPTKQHESREEQREELLKEDAGTKRAATERGETHDTVPGYAGSSSTTIAGTPPKRLEKPENAVVGEGGTLTLPTEISYATAAYKKPSDAERIIGRALLEGDTFKGFHRKIIVDLTEAVTQEGAFNVFRNHNPDAIFEGFKASLISEEDAKAMVEEWRKEGAVPGQGPSGSQEDNNDKKSKKDEKEK
jgi:hypothetical protein